MIEDSSEISVGLQALRMASKLCQNVWKDLAGGRAIQKQDRTPVTVADFGSQAIICRTIRTAFPEDGFVAEEDSTELRRPDHHQTLGQVVHHVRAFFPKASAEEVCSWIDLGTHSVTGRFWTLDPIDGTKGFLRGAQYAIALALIVNGQVQLGLMACPNLPTEIGGGGEERGCFFLGLRGGGAFQIDMGNGRRRPISVSRMTNPEDGTWVESVEPDHADHLTHLRIAQQLGMSRPPIKMDSQAKYGLVARGEATLYLRAPSPSEPDYREKIWDHAAGAIIAEEAGGRVTDFHGNPLDFSLGIRLERNRGVLVSNGVLHERVLEVLRG
ncbi:MAG: 3'(2'),5'-bisphosphate nucleotidase [Desulfobacterota bacterium]|nr:3'(2'),5'-bisphosphate nucleotidase [Thermodesulfobacteriota bacterium]